MSKRLIVSAALVVMTALPVLAQSPQQPRTTPGTVAPPAQQRATTFTGNVACPSSITATVNPGGGWTGGSYSATLFNLSATDGSRTDCIYKFDYVTISKPAPAGQTCTVAADKKSFICK